MVDKLAPATTKNRSASAPHVVCSSDARLIEERPGWESAHGNRGILGVPFEPAEVPRRKRAKIAIRQRSSSRTHTVYPWREVAEPYTQFHGQLLRRLPRILYKEFPGGIGDVIDAILACLIVAIDIAGEQIGILIAGAEAVPAETSCSPLVLSFAGCAFRIHS